MKGFIRTYRIGSGEHDLDSGDRGDPFRPFLAGYEFDDRTRFSNYQNPADRTDFVVRLSATQAIYDEIVAQDGVTALTDDEAAALLESLEGEPIPLESIDRPDIEVDRWLQQEGFDPIAVRSSVQTPSRGHAVLGDQEYVALKTLMNTNNVPGVGDLPAQASDAAGVPESVRALVHGIVDGRSDSHRQLLDQIRSPAATPPWRSESE